MTPVYTKFYPSVLNASHIGNRGAISDMAGNGNGFEQAFGGFHIIINGSDQAVVEGCQIKRNVYLF